MKLQWFWNREFEGLMKSVGEFLATKKNIKVTSTELRCHPDKSLFYWTMIYSE